MITELPEDYMRFTKPKMFGETHTPISMKLPKSVAKLNTKNVLREIAAQKNIQDFERKQSELYLTFVEAGKHKNDSVMDSQGFESS